MGKDEIISNVWLEPVNGVCELPSDFGDIVNILYIGGTTFSGDPIYFALPPEYIRVTSDKILFRTDAPAKRVKLIYVPYTYLLGLSEKERAKKIEYYYQAQAQYLSMHPNEEQFIN